MLGGRDCGQRGDYVRWRGLWTGRGLCEVGGIVDREGIMLGGGDCGQGRDYVRWRGLWTERGLCEVDGRDCVKGMGLFQGKGNFLRLSGFCELEGLM